MMYTVGKQEICVKLNSQFCSEFVTTRPNETNPQWLQRVKDVGNAEGLVVNSIVRIKARTVTAPRKGNCLSLDVTE